MNTFHVSEETRIVSYSNSDKDDFDLITMSNRTTIRVIASDGVEEIKNFGWEHVSVVAISTDKKTAARTPTWSEMCKIKDLFWDEEDVVMQIHPKKSQYVNLHPHVLHLWRPTSQEIPLPPIEMV